MRRNPWIWGLAVLLMATVTRAEDAPVNPNLPLKEANPKLRMDKVLIGNWPGGPAVESKYWLGIACRPVTDALRAHVDVPEGHGVAVLNVVPDSPAAKAGIERHDILLKADGKKVAKPLDLVKAVEAAEGKEMTLELLREGKSKTLKATPQPRPEAAPPTEELEEPPMRDLHKWFERIRPDGAGGPSMRFRFLQPGMILPKDAPMHPPLPEDTTVTIMKHGDEPAKITVEHDGKKYETTEDKLDELPEEVRPFVDRMLGGGMPLGMKPGPVFHFTPEWPVPGQKTPMVVPEEETRQNRLEKRLDEMNRRLDQLREKFDAMRNR